MKDLLNEEINRIRTLIGNNQKFNNLIYEQSGRFFKKVWDDFATKNPTVASKFDVNQIKNFTDTDIKSLDSLFKHIESNSQIWKAIGIPDSSITVLQALKKNIIDKKNPSILFRESSNGKYFFEYVPVEGGLRGELFYWYSKSYPKEWIEGLKSLPDAEKPKTTGLKALDNVEISTNVDLPTLTTVRVDKNGYPVDFKNGKPVDLLGNEVKLLDDGKPDTALVKVEKTETTDLAPIRVDDYGKPIDVDSNNRPIDIDGNEINVGDDGRPTDPDRLRTDEEYNPVDSSGNPLDDAGKYRREQILTFGKLEKIWETYIVPTWPGKIKFWQRIIEIINGVDVQEKVLKEFNENLNTLVRQTLDNTQSGLDIVTLRDRVIDKFLELQKISQDKLSPLLLTKIKDRVKKIEMEGFKPGTDEYYKRLEDLNDFWKQLETKENGLGTLFQLMEKDKSIPDNIGARINAEWKDYWYRDILNEKLKNTGKETWRQYSARVISTLAKRYWARFWTQSPYSKLEFQRIMLRYNASPNAILYRQLVHLVGVRVLQPIIWGTAVYLFYGNERAFGGFRRILEDKTGYNFIDADRVSIWDEYIMPQLKKPFGISEEEFSIIQLMIASTPTWFDEGVQIIANTFSESEKSKEEIKKKITITGATNLKYEKQILEAEYQRELSCIELKSELKNLDGWTYVKLNNDSLEEAAKKLSSLLRIPMDKNQIIDTKAKLDSNDREIRPTFYLDGVGQLYVTKSLDRQNVYYVEREDGRDRTPMIDFLQTFKAKIIAQPELSTEDKTKEDIEKEKIEKVKDVEQKIKDKTGLGESFYIRKKTIMENNGKKFGEDNFKHWKETFTFKSEDKSNPGQFKEVKIKMEDVMDRINHYRKKYDEDDSFVRAVVDTHPDVVKIMYTKGLADINESATPRGLALVLRVIKESRGEMEIFSVARPANGNWFLVKGDYTQSQLANMDLEKKEPKDKEEEKEVSGSEELKKKEQTAVELLKRNEREGLNDLPTKVREKLREKMGKGWTTEPMPSFLNKIATKSEINTIFNDKIEIYKLESNDETFDTISDNSSQIFIKRGFCRSLYVAADNAKLNEKQEKVVDHILDKCDKKFLGKLGVRNF